MSTFLFDEIVFGPVKSRRLGISLGINLLPTTKKVCNYNCAYCECGWTYSSSQGNSLPAYDEIKSSLNNKLSQMKAEGKDLDVITFAGNGEPTLHPEFQKIIDFTIEARKAYFPKARIAVLSNGSLLHKAEIRKALSRVDEAILKLDSANQESNLLLNHPRYPFNTNDHIAKLKLMNGQFILQSLFVEGVIDGIAFNNSSDSEVNAWLKVVKDLRPKKVMIYTIARDTAAEGLRKVLPERLNEIAAHVHSLGIETQVSE